MVMEKVTAILLLGAAHTGLSSASSLHNNNNNNLASSEIRALANSPSGNYAPQVVTCPSIRPTIRGAGSGLSQSEKDFLTKRRAATVQPMKDFMTRANIADFDAESYLTTQAKNVENLPNIAIALSGGGYRALMNGGGFVAAADSNTGGSTEQGGIGGLLQSSTYLAGLSGGGWLVGSLYANNFSSVQDLMGNSDVWQFQDSIFTGPSTSSIGIVSTVEYWTDVNGQVDDKANAGYNTSVTDYWGRALSYQLINAPDGGPAYTWSSIALDQNLIDGNIPMPILVADGRNPGELVISINATNYEMNPWEIGTFDPTVYGFVPTKYVGSNFSAGVVPDDGSCVEGFDQAGFVMGTSSSLFNQFLLANISSTSVPTFVANVITSLLTDVGNDNNDIAQWKPNPFLGYNPSTNLNADEEQLSLVDGGEDLQNIPLHPLLQPIRAVDVIFAVDSSADTTTNWPNGTALRASYERSLSSIANGTLFPAVPDANTFINLGLNNRPAFFGCDAANFTLAAGQAPPPLVVYLPNAPYMTLSNVTTFTPSYEMSQRNDIIMNGAAGGSQGNSSLDASWPACVACAALSRSLTRTGTAVPSGCTACFKSYCWNGTLDTREVSGEYQPEFKIGGPSSDSGGASSSSHSAGVKLGAQGVWVALVAGTLAVIVHM